MTDDRFWRKVDKRGGPARCWQWTGCCFVNGYGRVRRRGRTHVAHRFAFELTNGAIPPGMLACHSCDNRRCCNPAHLFIGTDRDNVRDCMNKGRRGDLRGERHGMARLTTKDVRAIRRRRAKGELLRDLARSFGVTAQAICYVVHRHSWGHV